MLAHQIEFAAQMSGHLELDGKRVKKKTFTISVQTEETPEKELDGCGEFTIDGRLVESDWRAKLVKVSPVNTEATYSFSIE